MSNGDRGRGWDIWPEGAAAHLSHARVADEEELEEIVVLGGVHGVGVVGVVGWWGSRTGGATRRRREADGERREVSECECECAGQRGGSVTRVLPGPRPPQSQPGLSAERAL